MVENVPPEIPKLFTELEMVMKKYRKWHDIRLCRFFLIYPSFMVGSKQKKLADCLKRLIRALVHKQLIKTAKELHLQAYIERRFLEDIL